MKFKKIYIEITNNCNLKCDFCIKNDRAIKYISESEFETIINKINNYTDYIYMHILGEPLLHPKINELINIANKYNKYVNITTNGYLIHNIKNNINIRQINISLHSYNEKYGTSLEDYMNNIYDSIEQLIENDTYISLRLWVKNKNTLDLLNNINNKYKTNIKVEDLNKGNITIKDKLYISINEEFIWPDMNNQYYEEEGNCYALKDHIGILSNGTVIPCCLDSKGIINLGNIFNEELNDMLIKERPINMINNFKNNKKCEELCKHCKYL